MPKIPPRGPLTRVCGAQNVASRHVEEVLVLGADLGVVDDELRLSKYATHAFSSGKNSPNSMRVRG